MRPLVAGNWKMNGLGSDLAEIEEIAVTVAATDPQADVVVCPPATLVARAAAIARDRIRIGGQDCHAEPFGASTGDVSAEMLKDAGARFVIVGHSERRQLHGETDGQVLAKAWAARRAGLCAIICVGESESERDTGRAFEVVARQLLASVPDDADGDAVCIAYEPVWAIGTGRTAAGPDILAMHAHVRRELCGRFGAGAGTIRILYGGSVRPGNAREILALEEVGGALVGGASLRAASFCRIVEASRANA